MSGEAATPEQEGKRLTAKSLKTYMETEAYSIGKGSGFIKDAIHVLEWAIKDLKENEPHAVNTIITLEEARDFLEIVWGDMEED